MSLTTNGFDQPLGPLVHGWTPPAFPVPLKMQGSYCTVEPFDRMQMDPRCSTLCRKSNLTGPTCHAASFCDHASLQYWIQTACLGDHPQVYTFVVANL